MTMSRDDATDATAFYRHVLDDLLATGVPFMLGGLVAVWHYTGAARRTKDLDVFCRPQDVEPLHDALTARGYDVELVFPHWLAKIHGPDRAHTVDVIFSSGNGLATVDDLWLCRAEYTELWGPRVAVCPPEEVIWSKAFVMERERYDGADVLHVIRARGRRLDWWHLLRRFDVHWRVLWSHLVLFDYVYPAERDAVPRWVVETLESRAAVERQGPAPDVRRCHGTLLSRTQYRQDLAQGWEDARRPPVGTMSDADIARWDDAASE